MRKEFGDLFKVFFLLIFVPVVFVLIYSTTVNVNKPKQETDLGGINPIAREEDIVKESICDQAGVVEFVDDSGVYRVCELGRDLRVEYNAYANEDLDDWIGLNERVINGRVDVGKKTYISLSDEFYAYGGSTVLGLDRDNLSVISIVNELYVPNKEKYINGREYAPVFELFASIDDSISADGRYMALKIKGCTMCTGDTNLYVLDIKMRVLLEVGQLYLGYLDSGQKLVYWEKGKLFYRAGSGESRPDPVSDQKDLGYRAFVL